ncbi:hypothetical protein H5410_036116 [Solanum commersonii]|uniref:Uncharacterized protein n=1 Tax=Solanum commersonii TaxID=4109 RepID=A0A9J5Y6L7_SOLCO|nr:hypothetical protein H5410_036116 [Solanum commersonii]
MGTIDIAFTHVKDEESSIPTSNCLENGKFPIFKAKQNFKNWFLNFVKKCAAKDNLAQLVEIADQLDDLPFGLINRLSALAFRKFKFCKIGRYNIASQNRLATR